MRRLLSALVGLTTALTLGPFGPGTTSATAATTTTVGSVDGAPQVDCGAQSCVAVQAAGTAATLVGTTGTVRALRLRHGPVEDGGDLLGPTAVRVLVLDRSGDAYTVVRRGPALALSATAAPDSTSTFSGLQIPVSAGQYLGVEVTGPFAQSRPLFLATAGPGDTAAVHAAAHESGTASYTPRPGLRALFAADVVAGDGGSDGSGGSGGSGDSGTGTGTSGPALACPAPAARTAARSARMSAPTAPRPGRRWGKRMLGRQDRMRDVQLAYDGRGRPHTAARGAARYRVHYFGPGGHRALDSTVDQNDGVGLAIAANGEPVLVWGERKPTTGADGRVQWCPRLHLAVPGGEHLVLRALPESTRSAFLHPEIARVGRALHLAYDVNGRLVHHRVGNRPTTLPVTGVRRIRMAAHQGRLLLGATTSGGRLTVLVRTGSGRFRTLLRAQRVHDFGLAYAGRKPVVAWSGGTVKRLTVATGGKVVRTRTPAEAVGVATSGKVAHVVFSTVARTTCGLFGCLRSGVYHVALKGRRIVQRPSVVQRSGESPFRLAVATTGRTVGVAMSRNGVTTLHQRRR